MDSKKRFPRSAALARIFGFTAISMNFTFYIDILSQINAKLMKNTVKPNICANGALRGNLFFGIDKSEISAYNDVISQR